LVNGGERSLVANLAAANTFTASHLDTSEAQTMIQRAKIFYITGFFLTVSVDAILTIAKHSVEHSKIFAMNLSAPFLIQFFGDQLASAMPYTDFVFGNESEAAEYGKAKDYGDDIRTVALKIAAQIQRNLRAQFGANPECLEKRGPPVQPRGGDVDKLTRAETDAFDGIVDVRHCLIHLTGDFGRKRKRNH
jgi:sugar/nucleoside kinase (ribokinase family)